MNYLTLYGVSERFITQACQYPQYQLARITAQYRGKYKVVTEHGERQAHISGKMRFDTGELCQYPAVGDFVMVSQEKEKDELVIYMVLPRKSVFVRKAVGITGQAQPVAANIDTVFLCMSLNGNYSLNRMERYLSIAWDSGALPVIVLTKADLSDDLDELITEVQGISCFSDVISVSMFDKNIRERFAPYFRKNQTCAFIGSSGVGKSTIINRLLDKDMTATHETGRDDKGKHTTTRREMFACPLGGVVIDTPGMREMGADSVDLSKSFNDIEDLAGRCRFNDCTHTNEPGCAVIEAVENRIIDRRRLDNYFKLRNESGYDGLTSKEIEVKKLERMFKDAGGMKNARKFAKQHRKR